MSKPFKFRYVHEIVGVFVLLVVAALVAAVVLVGQSQEWFVPKRRLHIDFPVEGSFGLQKGAQVQILGWKAGTLESIALDADGRMSGEIVVKGDFIRFVCLDSEVVIKKLYGIAGESFLEISPGHLDPLPEGFNLAATKDTELLDMASDLLTRMEEIIIPTLEKVAHTVEEYGKLAEDLRSTNGPVMRILSDLQQVASDFNRTNGPLARTLANVEGITAGIEKGEGSAGKLLKDPIYAEQTKEALANLNAAMVQLSNIMVRVEQASQRLPPIAENAQRVTDELPSVVVQTRATLREAERMIQGIQRSWLLRGNMPPDTGSELIGSSEVSRP